MAESIQHEKVTDCLCMGKRADGSTCNSPLYVSFETSELHKIFDDGTIGESDITSTEQAIVSCRDGNHEGDSTGWKAELIDEEEGRGDFFFDSYVIKPV